MCKKIAVIGAGASGLMAAYTAASYGGEVTVFERNEKAGKKIYITGKGRCNVTNDSSPETVLENIVRNGKFLSGAIRTFSPEKLMSFLEENGLPLKVERGNRVFPLSDKASDVTKCLERCCRSAGVAFRFNTRIQSVLPAENDDWRVTACDGADYRADAVIVCTGGVSYPATGSSGDGYKFADALGIKVTPLRPSLCGLCCKADWLDVVCGLSLKNVQLSAWKGNKKLFSLFGEMLFTHFGISGPIVLTASAMLNREELQGVVLSIDLKPALDRAALERRILRDFDENKNKQVCHVAEGLLPKSLVRPVLQCSGIEPSQPVHSVSRMQREKFITTLKGLPLFGVALRPIEEAVVTSGGVDVKEVDPKTMQSKRCRAVYFCGEVLDVDALTGGFNLQIAFTTGYIAGKASATL